MQSLKAFGSWGRVCLLLVLAVGLTSVSALAQNSNTGELKGTVKDASSAVVPGVSVSIKNVQTGVETPSTTNGSGIYDVPFLAPGNYTITFAKQGFRDFVREGVKLETETVEMNATLQVGTATQEVVVNAETSLVETETTGQHVDLDTAEIAAAPIVGTDWRASLVALMPGVNVGAGGAGPANGQSAGVNGTQGYNINFLVDGSAATDPRDFNGSNNITPIDSIAGISMNASNAPAQYGNGLTSINVITKSGTNQWHGSAFEYVQNTALNARNFFDNTGTKPVEHWNNYGGTVGGPVLKNKLFFFFAFERNPSSSPTQGFYSYPTAAMEAGNFYGIPGSTGTAFSSTGTLLGAQDPVALKLQSYFPAATAPGWVAGCPGPVNVGPSVAQTCNANNDYNFNGSSPNLSTWYTGKVDYNISSKQKLSFSFNYYPNFVSYIPADPLYPNDASAYASAHNYNLTGQFSDVYTISPTVLNEFRVGAMREDDVYRPPSLGKDDPTTIGLEPAYGTNAPANVFPRITIDTGAGDGEMVLGGGTGNGNIDAVLGEGTYNVSDVLTLIRGRHTIKVGGEYDRDYQNYTNWGDLSSGSFEFNGGVTGIPYADFLSGDVYGWYVYEYDATSAHMWNTSLFASDDFKVTSHLTLNLGLRWQVQSGWGVTGNLFGDYDPLLPNPTADGGLYKGGILYGGQSDALYGGPASPYNSIQNTDYKEFAPRIGVAWSPAEKWSVRASYSVFDTPRDAENYTDGALGLGFNPHNEGNGGYVNGSYAFKLATGPPAGTVVFPTLQTLSSAVDNFSSVTYYPRSMPTQYVSTWMLDVQHEFAGGVLVDAGYVYTRGTNLNFQTDINQAPISQFQCSGYNCGNPNPVFNSIEAQLYDGWSNYNALQVRLQKRASYGLSFLVNYSWSRSLDTGTGNNHGSGIDEYQNAFSPAANYGLSDFNATNTVSGQITWELPFGSGRQFALHGIADEIVGGWRASGVFQWHSGLPYTPVIQGSVADGVDPGLTPSFSAGSTLYPEIVGNPTVSNPTISHWFNTAAFANPAGGTFGNTGRNTLIGPGFTDVDFSIGKEFSLHVREGMKLEIRADAFNVFNHPNFANPDADVGLLSNGQLADSAGGTISHTENYTGQRIVQLGLHFRF
jgi:outer membrane receptor protein involved in Fe transport